MQDKTEEAGLSSVAQSILGVSRSTIKLWCDREFLVEGYHYMAIGQGERGVRRFFRDKLQEWMLVIESDRPVYLAHCRKIARERSSAIATGKSYKGRTTASAKA